MPSYLPELIAELERHGITDHWSEIGRKHIKLYWRHEGQQRFYVTGKSPSDGRHGLQNALSELRRVAGVRRQAVKSSRPRRRRAQSPERPLEAPSLSVVPDALEKLARVRDPLELRLQQALWRLDMEFEGSFEEWLNRAA